MSESVAFIHALVVVTIVAGVSDDQPGVQVELYVDTGAGFVPQQMTPGGGSEYSTLLGAQPSGSLVRYYVAATDGFPQTTTEPQATNCSWRITSSSERIGPQGTFRGLRVPMTSNLVFVMVHSSIIAKH